MQRIITKINETISKQCMLDSLEESQRLKEDLGFDSLGLTELIVALEDDFAIEFQMADLDPAQLNTVLDIYVLVQKYV